MLEYGEMPTCECCPKEKGIAASHVVTVEFNYTIERLVHACPYHVGMARRFHTFGKFLADYNERTSP